MTYFTSKSETFLLNKDSLSRISNFKIVRKEKISFLSPLFANQSSPDRPPLPQEGAIRGWWSALYIARPHPPQERADGRGSCTPYIIIIANIYYILRTVAYAKPLRSRHVESCTYNTRQVQSIFKTYVGYPT